MVKIISCNVRGLRSYAKRKQFFHMFHLKDYDIVLLQETHSTKHVAKLWRAQWGGPIFYSHGTNNARGVAIMFAKKFNIQIVTSEHDNLGRKVVVKFNYEDMQLIAICVYAPNTDNPQFFVELYQQMAPYDKQNIILGGDFNLVLNVNIDKKGGRPSTHTQAQQVIHSFSDEYDLVDIWRLKYPHEEKFTWAREGVQVRLDFFLLSRNLVQMVIEADIILSHEMSDHNFPYLHMHFSQNQRGKGSWKFNLSLLRDHNYVTKINQIIDDQTVEEYKSHRHRWEVLKMLIRSESIRLSIFKAKQRSEKLDRIEHQLLDLNRNRKECQPLSTAQIALRADLISQRQEILQNKVEGAILRSKIDWALAGNKPTKYFLNLEKTRYSRRTITRIRDQDGNLYNTTNQIQTLLHNFYSELFKSRDSLINDTELETFFEGIQSAKISDVKRHELDSPFTLSEYDKALFDMKNGKTPGPDGFPAEFYRQFWHKLRSLFANMIVESLEEGFDTNFLRCLMCLIGKKDRDPLWIDNWRPISLLNCDYKILAKTIVNRLNKILPDIIDTDQKGFVKGRFIGENILELISLVEYCDKENIPAFLISCDFFKAFDSVSHKFFAKCLSLFGFGPKFCNMIKTIYKNVDASVLNNGHFSPHFKIERGFCQGDPLSSINFIITLQALMLKLKANSNIQGIDIDHHHKMTGLFADDIWAVLHGTQENLQAFLNQIEQFKISGLELNYDKTQIMRIGSLRDANAQFYTQKPLHWVDPNSPQGIKVLGIALGTPQAIQSNFDNILTKIDHIVDVWNQRAINIPGKIVIINSLLLSTLVYKTMMLPLPSPQLCDQIKQKIKKFLWDNKPARIRYSKVILDKNDGGLGLIDIHLRNSALKASWIPRIVKNDDSVFARLMYYHLPIPHPWIWECNITGRTIDKIFPTTLWMQLWSAWAQFNYEPPYCRDSVLLQVLWYNEQILKNNQPWISQQLVECGIIRFQDIYDENTDTILTYQQACVRFNTNALDVMHYNSIVASIPWGWKDILNVYVPLEPTLIDLIYKKPKMSSYLYKRSRNCLYDADGCRLAWQNDLGITIDQDTWNKYLAHVHNISSQADLAYLQYRIVHRILTTNRLRNKWDAQVSPMCQFCNTCTETLVHLLCECHCIIPLWSSLQKILRNLLRDPELTLSHETILFNCSYGPQKKFINSAILCIKHYIYSSKCLGQPPQLTQIPSKILQAQNTEKLIAFRQNKIKQHDKKWGVFLAWMVP